MTKKHVVFTAKVNKELCFRDYWQLKRDYLIFSVYKHLLDIADKTSPIANQIRTLNAKTNLMQHLPYMDWISLMAFAISLTAFTSCRHF